MPSPNIADSSERVVASTALAPVAQHERIQRAAPAPLCRPPAQLSGFAVSPRQSSVVFAEAIPALDSL